MRQIPTLSFFLAVLVPLVQSVTAPALGDEAAKPWQASFDRCKELTTQGDYKGALEACEHAQELDADPEVLAYIAQIQTALLHPVQARDALQRYLRSKHLEPANRQLAEGQIRYLETLIVTLLVTSRVEGGEITIDDQVMDPSALKPGVQLTAGAHRITLKANGSTYTSFIYLRGGERTEIELPGSGSIALSCSTPAVRFFIDDQEVDPIQASRGVPQAAGAHRVTFKTGSAPWAEQQVVVSPDERLSVVCTQPAATVPAKPSMNQRGYWVTGAGLALAGAALVTAIYNGSEYNRWQTANESLRDNQTKLAFDQFNSQSQDNDQLMQSIKTRRKVAIGLGIAGGLVTAGGVALLFHDSSASAQQGSNSWFRKVATGVTLNAAVNSGEIAWRGAW